MLTRDDNGWQAYPMMASSQGNYGKALAAKSIAQGATVEAVSAGVRAEFERSVLAKRQAREQRNAQLAREFAADQARAQAARDQEWSRAVQTNRRNDVARLVYGVSDPDRWIKYAQILGSQADLAALENAQRFESDATRKRWLTNAIAQVRRAKAEEAQFARDREASLLAQQRPTAPASGTGYYTPSAPVKIDTSGYAAIVRENAQRAQNGQTPWGRTCWGRNC